VLMEVLAAVCKRPQWMPMAVMLTSATMLYTSFAEDDEVESYADADGEAGGKHTPPESATAVQRSIREVLAARDAPERVKALMRLRTALHRTYSRDAGVKLAGSAALWWTCRPR
jgi:hypothetical protein